MPETGMELVTKGGNSYTHLYHFMEVYEGKSTANSIY